MGIQLAHVGDKMEFLFYNLFVLKIKKMKFARRLKVDDERDKVWYEIIRLEYELSNGGSYSLRFTLNSHRRRYTYLCKVLKINWVTCL